MCGDLEFFYSVQ